MAFARTFRNFFRRFEGLEPMPKVIKTTSTNPLVRAGATMLNIACLPFWIGCAFVVLCIALLMTFGGRPLRV